MVLHIQGCVEHALKEDAAGIFNKPSRQPSLVRALNVVAAETLLAFSVTEKPRFENSDFLNISFDGYDVVTAIECLYYLAPEDQEVFFEKLAREHSGKIMILSGPIIGENEHRKYFTHQSLLETFTRHGMHVIEFHNLNIYRKTLLANVPAILVRLPLGGWLLDYLPSSMVYQRCYIIQIM
jgi:hypothetical protein